MLTLNDGRPELWQWDTGRTVAVDADCSQVHFSNKVFGRSIDVDVVDGVAIIPDILLQTDKDLNVWAFVGAAENGYTKISKIFKVNRRNKPADYVFTPQEQILLKDAIAIVETAKSAANDAIESAKQAQASAENAAQAKNDALTAQSKAEAAKSGAERAQNLAEAAMGSAENAAVNAEQALSAAVQARDDAVQEADMAKAAADSALDSESNAQTHAAAAGEFASQASTARDEAQQSAASAEAARSGAEAAQQGAEAAKEAAKLAKTAAETAANNASNSADDAITAKNEAESAQNAAAGSANAAQDSKNAAAQSAEAANTAKTAAEQARQGAETAAIRQPIPNADTGTWWVWNAAAGEYTDSGEAYQGESGVYYGSEEPTDPSVRCWIDPNGEATIETDDTLTKSGKAADAKAVGDELSALKDDLSNLSGGSKNIIKLQNRTTVVNDVSITTNALGTATMHGTATASGNYKIALCDTFTLKAGTYTAHMEKVNVDDAVGTWYIVSNGAKLKAIPELQPVTFTIDTDTDVTIGVNMPEGTTYNCEIKLQIESGSVSTEFVPSVTANDFFARKEIENIKANTVKKYSSKTWVCVGDSLTEENTATTKHYFDYISDKTGINVVNMGNGGSGYRKEYELNTAFYQRVANDLPAIGVDVVTIFGSGNDLNPIDDGTGRGWSAFLGSPTDNMEDTICGCINLTIDNVYAKLPTVPLGIILPTPWASAWNDTENRLSNADDTVTQYKKWYTYTEAIKTICQNRGIPYLDLFRESTLRPWDANYRNLCYSKDAGQDGNPAGVHPDETGHSIIAPMISEFIDKLISTR